MDTTEGKLLPTYEHPLFPSARSIIRECAGCHVNGLLYGGYFCNEPYCHIWFHKECGEAPLEIINHSFHPQHPLLLTNESRDGLCDLCGQQLLSPSYSCSTCEFKLDLTCGIKPSPPAIEHPLCHNHPVVFLKIREEKVPCDLCKESIDGPSYSCLECDVYFHVNCVNTSEEVNHPCHPIHPLKLVASGTRTNDFETSCWLCGEIPKSVFYHCFICNFTSCLRCTKNPPPLVIDHIKTHKHPLSIFPRRTKCTCDVCGIQCDDSVYVCIQCVFVTHKNCIDRPRVININRHDHRIHFTHHLGAEFSLCGVCHKDINQFKGGYSCSACPNYVVHTTCAMRIDVWDGVELEGTPEITEDISPFKVVGDNLICHFSHEEHPLRLHKDDVIHDEGIRCAACIHPVGFGSIYVCEEEECCFVLHEKCANLPMKKRLVFGTRPYTLKKGTRVIDCKLCGMLSYGFAYITQDCCDVDVHCGSLNEPLYHGGYEYPLYFAKKEHHRCDGCQKIIDEHMLRCNSFDFDLCLYCATLPEEIWHTNDGHPLTLCYGEKEKASGKHWCDICEK
ncbi:Protein kinase C-like phorbol ester/diacylglycerol-binding domain [Arabidopsis thaliana x Arabidopsis arenosa]|uniref:Phorbol-ester/DAG-type domain-containing protein n=2 Tax=Arabidopsis TaxID=3701 RepID=A0A178VKR9_ARATH|nr:Protein kinase C-like phorbol ester/diacylglycerol-binding domain [Arabidopsis thaliana x Arabidopsis arenosa]OAP06969.1 hypothetical protein AXX17_AT3G31830 [Arabidopsis thaliana]